MVRSSTEVEYWTLAAGTFKIAWVNSMLLELGIRLLEPPSLLCDNVGATHLSLNLVMHSRMQHITIDPHFIQDYVARGTLKVGHVSTEDQLADMLTKPLPHLWFRCLSSKIGIIDGTLPLRGHIGGLNAPQSTAVVTKISTSPLATSTPQLHNK